MKSHLSLQLLSAVTQNQAVHLPHFCSFPIPNAIIQLYTFPSGQILRQSFSKYLLHTELFEYLIDEPVSIKGKNEESAIIMVMIIEGQASVFDEKDQLIAELTASSYHFVCVPKGSYCTKLNTGGHKLLAFTLRAEWFMRKAPDIHEFKTLIAHYLNQEPGIYALPNCSLSKDIVHRLKKQLSRIPIHSAFLSDFVMRLTQRYGEMLMHNNYTTEDIDQAKAAAILSFINQNFKESIVEGSPQLARHFGASISNLNRLAKIAFGKPLRKHVIVLRLNYAMEQIVTTKKPIHEIALLAGYNDSRYFSRAFKKHFQQNPGSVRSNSGKR